jgi:lysophospholipase L1-like esterase
MIRVLLFLFLITPLFAADSTAPLVLDIVYLGDSITAGVGLQDPRNSAPPVLCSKEIEAKLKNATVYFSNSGRGGTTTVDFLPSSHADFPAAEDAAKKLVADHPGKLIFNIMLGTNDSAVVGPRGSPVSPEQYGKNLTTIVDQLLVDFPGSQVVINRPIWYSPNTHNGATYDQPGLDRLNSYLPVIRAVVVSENTVRAGQVHLGDLAAYSYFQTNYLKELRPEDGAEGTFYLHPNVIGAASLGKFWANGILAGISLTH